MIWRKINLGREQRPLCQAGCTDRQTWLVKSSGAATVSGGVQLTEVCFLKMFFFVTILIGFLIFAKIELIFKHF